MSVRLMGEVWNLTLPHEQQLVLLALADNAQDDGTRCFPGVGYLAWKTGYSERNVQYILRKLEAAGLIVAVAYPDGGRGRATEYRLRLEHGARKAAYTPSGHSYNGAKTAPYGEENGAIYDRNGAEVAPITERNGAISSTETVQSTTETVQPVSQNGASLCTPTVINRINHQGEPDRARACSVPAPIAAIDRRSPDPISAHVEPLPHATDDIAAIWQDAFGKRPSRALECRLNQYLDTEPILLPGLVVACIQYTAEREKDAAYFHATYQGCVTEGKMPGQRPLRAPVPIRSNAYAPAADGTVSWDLFHFEDINNWENP